MEFAKKVWKLLVAIKDGLSLVFLLLFFGLLFAILTARPNPAAVKDGALVLDLEGFIVEEKTPIDPFQALFSGRTQILVTTPRALQERVPIPERLAELRRTFRAGDQVVFSELPGYLEAQGFEKVALVEAVGQFAVRGGILDIFSVAAGDPVRIEFWGDEIESIRSFDILDQRSTGELAETHVLPVDFRRNEENSERTVARSLLELLPSDAIIVRLGTWEIPEDVRRTWTRVSTLYEELVHSGATPLPPPSGPCVRSGRLSPR